MSNKTKWLILEWLFALGVAAATISVFVLVCFIIYALWSGV